MSEKSFFCCVDKQLPNIFIQNQGYEHKTSEELIKILNIQNQTKELILATPFYKRVLDNDEKPFELEPNLLFTEKPERYPPPNYFLQYQDENNPISLQLIVKVKTQTDINFPSLNVPLDYKDKTKLTGSSFAQKCAEIFAYGCKDTHIMFNDTYFSFNFKPKDLFDFFKRKTMTFTCSIFEADLKPIKHRIYLCEQIIDSEDFYIKTLETMMNYWEPNIRQQNLIKPDFLSEMFKLVPTMIQGHKLFLSKLKEQTRSFDQAVCPAFLNFMPYFQMSSGYISNYRLVDTTYNELIKNKSIRNAFKQLQQKCPDDSGRDFMQFYISPVQRFPKYTLLLRDLDKRTPDFHPDKTYLPVTLEQMNNINSKFDSSSVIMEQSYIMQKLQAELGNSKQIVIPSRNLLAHAQIKGFTKTTKLNLSDPTNYSNFSSNPNLNLASKVAVTTSPEFDGLIYLFNDLLLITSKVKNTQTIVLQEQLFNLQFLKTEKHLIFYTNSQVQVISLQTDEAKKNFYPKMIKYIHATLQDIEIENKSFITWECLPYGKNPASKQVACQINDNSILFIGGRNEESALSQNIMIYDTEQNQWTVKQSPLPPRWAHTVTKISDSEVIVSFGKTQEKITNDLWKYNFVDDKWEEIKFSTEPTPRCGHSCVKWNDKLVYFGGMLSDRIFSNIVSIYDITKNEYYDVETTNTPKGRFLHTAILLDNDRMLVVYGTGEHNKYFDVYFNILNLNTMKWTCVKPKNAREFSGVGYQANIIGNIAFMVCGMKNADTVPAFGIDLISLQPFSLFQFGNIPNEITDTCSCSIKDMIYVYGGKSALASDTSLSSLFVVDVKNVIQDNNFEQLNEIDLTQEEEDQKEISQSEQSNN